MTVSPCWRAFSSRCGATAAVRAAGARATLSYRALHDRAAAVAATLQRADPGAGPPLTAVFGAAARRRSPAFSARCCAATATCRCNPPSRGALPGHARARRTAARSSSTPARPAARRARCTGSSTADRPAARRRGRRRGRAAGPALPAAHDPGAAMAPAAALDRSPSSPMRSPICSSRPAAPDAEGRDGRAAQRRRAFVDAMVDRYGDRRPRTASRRCST